MVTADPLTLSLRFAAMGVTVSALTLTVKCSNNYFVNALTFVCATPARNRSHT